MAMKVASVTSRLITDILGGMVFRALLMESCVQLDQEGY